MSEEKDKSFLERLVVAEERGKSNSHRLDEVEEDVDEMKQNKVILDKHDEEIKILKNQSSTIYRLAVNQEQMTNTLNNMVDDNRQQMGKFTETLGKMNDSLNGMNQSQREMSNEIKLMQKDITSTKEHIEEVEVIANTNKENMNFNLVKFFTNDGTKLILVAIISAVLAYIGLK